MHPDHRCRPGWTRQTGYRQPPVNIEEKDDGFILQLYAPALTREQISVSTRNDLLLIRLKATQPSSPETRFTRREYGGTDLERSFELRGKVDVDQIRALYANGVLRIELPKTDAAKRPPQEVFVS
jgi:HSP20 family protein